MAEFKIDGRMTVRKLKENFKNEFEGTLRVYNGREKADDNATLASIRKNDDMKVGEYVCRASRTVGKFEKEMLEVFGIKVQVASPDDFVLALDGITLANLKNIKGNATKADMEELVAYRRKARSEGENTEDAGHSEENTKEDEKITLRKFIENVEFTIDYASSPAPNNDYDSPEYQDWIDEVDTIRFTIDPDITQWNGYDMDEGFWDSLCDCNDDVDTSTYLYADEDMEEEIEYTYDEISTLVNGELGKCIVRAALNTYSMFIQEIDFPVYNVHAELEYKDTEGDIDIYYERESIIEEVSFE